MGDQSTLIYSQLDGRAEGGREEEMKMEKGLRERERSWKVVEMSHSDDSDSLAVPAKVTTQWCWKFILATLA